MISPSDDGVGARYIVPSSESQSSWGELVNECVTITKVCYDPIRKGRASKQQWGRAYTAGSVESIMVWIYRDELEAFKQIDPDIDESIWRRSSSNMLDAHHLMSPLAVILSSTPNRIDIPATLEYHKEQTTNAN